MSNLVKAYYEYYNLSSQSNMENLFRIITNYNFKNYKEDMKKVYCFWKNKKINYKEELQKVNTSLLLNSFKRETKIDNNIHKLLSTNGSTRENPEPYLFPIKEYNFWFPKIEKTIIGNNATTLWINPIFEKGGTFKVSYNKPWYPKCNYFLECNLIYKESRIKLIKLLDELYKNHGKINILTTCQNFITLTTNKICFDYLKNNYYKIDSIVNTDYEPLYKKVPNIKFKDQMIDWSTGTNFFTCDSGKKHILPIFFESKNKVINLLNLANNKFELSDELKIKKFEKCSCGKFCCEFDFIPHYSNQVIDKHGKIFNDITLLDNLKGEYHNVQLFQSKNSEKVILYLSNQKKTSTKDQKIILKKLTNYFDNIKIINDMCFKVGARKYPPFWADDCEAKVHGHPKEINTILYL